jgi:tRNA nucleotidyltransferase (CCA-adding enzyme)
MAPERAVSSEELRAHLDQAALSALDCAVMLAERRSLALYLVGGAVRDLCLDQSHLDVDLVIDGDAIGLAREMAGVLDAKVVAHPRFGTAVVRGEGFRIDLAMARAEAYSRPGALPDVRSGSLADDLARRDFTINAVALALTGQGAGGVIDPHGGLDDIAAREVRVLHEGSFRDDPTRILRAFRYAGRFGFSLEAATERWLHRDLTHMSSVTGARLRRELERIAAEQHVAAIIRMASGAGALTALHEAVRLRQQTLETTAGLPDLPITHRDAALLCLLLAEAREQEASAAIERLHLTGRQGSAVRGFFALRAEETRLAAPAAAPSVLAAVFEAVPLPSVEAFALFAANSAGERARHFLADWRHVRPRLNGRDIEALGVPHGPRVGEALARLRVARMDGDVVTRDDEIAFVRDGATRPLAETSVVG